MALAGVKYFSAVSTNKRFIVHQHAEEARIEAMQRRMLGRVWKEKEKLLNEFIKINVKTATGSTNPRHIELKQMAVDPKLVLPLDLKSVSLKHQAIIAPVITIDGRGATLYPKKGAKHGRQVALTPKVYERMHKASNISSTLEHIATGNRQPSEPRDTASRPVTRHGSNRSKTSRTHVSIKDSSEDTPKSTGGKNIPSDRKQSVVAKSSKSRKHTVVPDPVVSVDKRTRSLREDRNFIRSQSAPVLCPQ